jgi:hypothetical protein
MAMWLTVNTRMSTCSSRIAGLVVTVRLGANSGRLCVPSLPTQEGGLWESIMGLNKQLVDGTRRQHTQSYKFTVNQTQ